MISYYYLVLVLFANCLLSFCEDIKVWGPGLKPHLIVLPARYFFIQEVDNVNNKFLNDLVVKISGTSKDGRQCRIWTNVLQSTDDIIIVRYKLYEVCYDLNIKIIKQSNLEDIIPPIIARDPVYPDDISCPSRLPLESWLAQYECKTEYSQMKKDLDNYPSIDFDEIHEGAVKAFNHSASMSVCNYVVKDNQVYRRCYGQHTGFKMFMDSILLSLTRKVHLPDLELWTNLGDWPLTKSIAYPMFSWCGSDDTFDIVMPTYEITESSLENMGRVSLDMLSVQGNNKKTWKEKESKLFWRGRDSNRRRLKLIDISRDHPELFNVSLTNFFFFKDEQEKYGPKQKHVSFFDFFDYKYQLNLDGTVAAYRFPYLLVGDAVVFKQDSKYYEYFYSDIRHWEHFIPIKEDLSDLITQIKWALSNEDKVLSIIKNARLFARENLMPKDVICYHSVLFNEWSKRIKNKIQVREEMELVSQRKTDMYNPCQTNGYHDEL